jgi:hypothetical protein
MTLETNSSEEKFGTTLAKSFFVNTAASAGIYAGFATVLVVAGKIIQMNDARKAKKTQS